VLLLLFLSFIFFQANQQTEKQMICSESSSTLDNECVVTKDGHQICGHKDIRDLCDQVALGFYLIVMGTVLMTVSQVCHNYSWNTNFSIDHVYHYSLPQEISNQRYESSNEVYQLACTTRRRSVMLTWLFIHKVKHFWIFIL
jgi:hypothetical protein